MSRLRLLATTWFACHLTSPLFDREAWLRAWDNFWADLSDEFSPEVRNIRRSQDREHFDSFLVDRGGGNFDAAGTGGQD